MQSTIQCIENHLDFEDCALMLLEEPFCLQKEKTYILGFFYN